jgi:hypothetical protein
MIVDPASPDPTPTPATPSQRGCVGCTQSSDRAAHAIQQLPARVFQSPSPPPAPTDPAPSPHSAEPLQPIPTPAPGTTPPTTPFDAPGAAEFFGSTRPDDDRPIDLATRPIIVNHSSTR